MVSIAVFTALVIVISGFISFYILLLPPVQQRVLAFIIKRIEPTITGSISIGSVSTNLYSTIDIYWIHLEDKVDPTIYMDIDHIRCNYILPLLLCKQVTLSSLVIDSVRLRCSIASDGRFDFPALPVKTGNAVKPKAEKRQNEKPWLFKARSVRLRNIQGEFNDSVNHQTGVVEMASITAKVPSLDSILVQLLVSQGCYTSPWWTGTIKKIDASVQFNPAHLNVTTVAVTTDRSSMIGKGIIPFNTNGLWNIEATVSSQIQAIPILYNSIPEFKPSGNLHATASWSGTMMHPQLSLAMDAYSIEFKDVVFDTLSVTATYDTSSQLTGSVNMANRIGRTDISLSGELHNLFSSPKVGRYAIDSRLQHIVPEKITPLKLHLPPNLSGITLSSQIHIDGEGVSSLPSMVTCSCTIMLPKLSAEPLLLHAAMHDSMVALSAAMSGNRLNGSCNYRLDKSLSGIFNVDLNELSEISSRFVKDPLTGSVKSRIRCGGTLQNPEFTAAIDGRTIAWRDAVADTVAAIVHIARNKVFLDTFFLSGNAQFDSLLDQYYPIDIKGAASILISGKGPLFTPDFTMVFWGTDLGYANSTVDSCSATITVAGLDSISLKNSYFRYYDHSTTLRCTGEYSRASHHGTVDLGLETLVNGRLRQAGKIEGKGVWQSDSSFAEIAISDLSLQLLSPFLSLEKKITGTVSASGSISGSNRNPLIKLGLEINKPGYDRFILQSCVLHALMADSTLEATTSLILQPASDSITVQARIPLLPSSSWKIDTTEQRRCFIAVKGNKIPVASFSGLLDSTWQIAGVLSLDAKAQLRDRRLVLGGEVTAQNGAIVNLVQKISAEGIAADIVLDGPYIMPEASFNVTSGPIRISGEQIDRFTGVGTASPSHLSLSSGNIELRDSGLIVLKGYLPLKPADSLPSGTSGNIIFSIVRMPLQLLSPFISGIAIQNGIIQGNGEVIFTEGKPQVNGFISLSNGMAALDDIEPVIGPATLSVRLAGDSIVVKNLQVVWGKGSARGSGSIVLRPESTPLITAVCTAGSLFWSMPEVVEGTIEQADLRCSTVNGRYVLSGAVKTGPCRYTQDVQIADFLTQLQNPHQPAVSKTPTDSILKNIQSDVSIDLQDNITVDMNLGYLKIDGNFLLSGSLTEPSYTGELHLTEGYVYYLDRKFTLERATLINYNPRILNPRIDLEAVAEVAAISGGQMETFTITLSVTGDLDNPMVKLSEKSGALNQVEIVSILTFGQSTGGMNGDVKERLRTFVGQSVLGFGTRKLEQFFGIEKIDLQGDLFGGKGAAASSRVTIAKRVTSRLMVLYESEIGNLNKPKISALYRILNNFFLSGERTSDGNAGVDLIFKYSK